MIQTGNAHRSDLSDSKHIDGKRASQREKFLKVPAPVRNGRVTQFQLTEYAQRAAPKHMRHVAFSSHRPLMVEVRVLKGVVEKLFLIALGEYS